MEVLKSSSTLFPVVSVLHRLYFSKTFSDFSCLPLQPHSRASSGKWRDSEDIPPRRKLELMDFCAFLFPKTFWYTELLGKLWGLGLQERS